MRERDKNLLKLCEEIVKFPGGAGKSPAPAGGGALDEVKKHLRTYAAHKIAAAALDAVGHEDADKHWRISSDAHKNARLVHEHGVKGNYNDFVNLKNEANEAVVHHLNKKVGESLED